MRGEFHGYHFKGPNKNRSPLCISHLAALFPPDPKELPDFPFCKSGPLQSLLSEIDYVLFLRLFEQPFNISEKNCSFLKTAPPTDPQLFLSSHLLPYSVAEMSLRPRQLRRLGGQETALVYSHQRAFKSDQLVANPLPGHKSAPLGVIL